MDGRLVTSTPPGFMNYGEDDFLSADPATNKWIDGDGSQANKRLDLSITVEH